MKEMKNEPKKEQVEDILFAPGRIEWVNGSEPIITIEEYKALNGERQKEILLRASSVLIEEGLYSVTDEGKPCMSLTGMKYAIKEMFEREATRKLPLMLTPICTKKGVPFGILPLDFLVEQVILPLRDDGMLEIRDDKFIFTDKMQTLTAARWLEYVLRGMKPIVPAMDKSHV